MSENQHPKAVLVSFTLQNGNPIVINAHAIDTIVLYGDQFHSAISTSASKHMEGKYYVVKGGPETIKFIVDKAIKDSEQ
jgi:hypothetical protein